MGMTRNTLVALSLAAALAACGSETAEPPVEHSSAPASPAASVSTAPEPPVMPEAAKAHTQEGAKAFVAYYVDLITYAEKTLDPSPVSRQSLASCGGCRGGIREIRRIARSDGHIEGASQTVESAKAGSVDAFGVVTVLFDLTNSRERVVVPGRDAVIHPAGRTPMLITLVSQNSGAWLVGEFKEQA